MSSGKAKWRGLSPCHTPFDEVFMEVMFTAISRRSMDRKRELLGYAARSGKRSLRLLYRAEAILIKKGLQRS